MPRLALITSLYFLQLSTTQVRQLTPIFVGFSRLIVVTSRTTPILVYFILTIEALRTGKSCLLSESDRKERNQQIVDEW